MNGSLGGGNRRAIGADVRAATLVTACGALPHSLLLDHHDVCQRRPFALPFRRFFLRSFDFDLTAAAPESAAPGSAADDRCGGARRPFGACCCCCRRWLRSGAILLCRASSLGSGADPSILRRRFKSSSIVFASAKPHSFCSAMRSAGLGLACACGEDAARPRKPRVERIKLPAAFEPRLEREDSESRLIVDAFVDEEEGR